MENHTKTNPFKQTQIIYFGLLIGQVLMGVLLFLLMQKMELERSVESPFNLIIPGAVAVGIIASQFLQRKQTESLPISASIGQKLEHFRKWGIMKWAVAEGGNLLSLVLTFLFGNITTYIWFGVGVVMFAFLRPTLDKFANDYQISQTEREQLSQ
jgi:hypothetical protein